MDGMKSVVATFVVAASVCIVAAVFTSGNKTANTLISGTSVKMT